MNGYIFKIPKDKLFELNEWMTIQNEILDTKRKHYQFFISNVCSKCLSNKDICNNKCDDQIVQNNSNHVNRANDSNSYNSKHTKAKYTSEINEITNINKTLLEYSNDECYQYRFTPKKDDKISIQVMNIVTRDIIILM
jgi:hypothetical protein